MHSSLKQIVVAASLAATTSSLACVELEGTLALADDCSELEEDLRARAIEEMERILAANLETALSWIQPLGELEEGSEARPENTIALYPCWDMMVLPGTIRSAAPTLVLASIQLNLEATAPTATSGTNNQVAGVAEADFVKNDGEYIYILADGAFQILDAWPPEQAHRIAEVPIEGLPKRLFVSGDRALVYTSLTPASGRDCSYGYGCDFTGDGAYLAMTVIDLSERTAPTILRETSFSGSYLNARRIGDVAHTVVTFGPNPENRLSYPHWPEGVHQPWRCGPAPAPPLGEEEVRRRFADLKESNRALIEAYDFLGDLPSITDTRYLASGETTETDLLDGCRDFYLSDSHDGRELLSLVSMEISQQDSLEIVTIVGQPGAVYASAESLYIATRHRRSDMTGWYRDFLQLEEATTVHKFALETGSSTVAYRGSGVVKGRVLNQFAMDEHAGHLRIATTTGSIGGAGTHSTLSVLREHGERLEVVGLVDELAPGEDIRSVRFDGDTGFIVTFKKTDPLFAFDLANPENPVLRGELKIPGFSTYMHLLDEDHLLTIGYDADDQGSFAWFQGIQLQIMDVSDLDDPRLIHKEVIGSRGTSSEAATDHLAFNYFPDRGLLAIPMTLCEDSGGGGSYGSELSFSGLLVYDVSIEDGLSRVGGVDHFDPASEPNVGCHNWWTNSSSVVQRSIFMSSEVEDFVYSIARDEILIASLEALEEPLQQIDLELDE